MHHLRALVVVHVWLVTGCFGLIGALLYLISSSELLGLGSIEIAQSMTPPVSGLWFTTLGVILFLRSYRK
jgi:hypothetical protein